MRSLSICLLLLSCCCARAQTNIDHGIWGRIQQNKVSVYGDTLIVRSAPDRRSNPQDTVYAGDNLEIIEVNNNSLEAKGMYAPWYKVSYTRNGARKQGFVWSALVGLNYLDAGGTRFVLGIERMFKKDTLIGEEKVTWDYHDVRMKAIGQGKRLDVVRVVEENPVYLSTIMERKKGPSGLKNVSEVISFTLSSEVSGMPSMTYPYAWTGRKFIALRTLNNLSDADVVYHSEKLVFPADKGGEPNHILWVMEEGESTNKKDKKGNLIYKKRTDTKKTVWKN